jgi:hypothetical protein
MVHHLLRRFSFELSPTESIPWAFDREPLPDEEITLGHHGVFRVIGPVGPNGYSSTHTTFAVERVRRATSADLRAQVDRGVNRLPPGR